MYIDKLDDIVNKYNNTHHRTIKMKPPNVKSSKLEELCLKNTAPWTYVISDFNGEEFFGTFCEKELQKKQIKKSFELKK